MLATDVYGSAIAPDFLKPEPIQHFPASVFPWMNPIHWLHSHFAVGGWSPLQRLSGMLTAHMTRIAPRNGFTWHPHRGLEIYTWVLEGTLFHQDTTGGKGEIGPGELQRMFSGDWIEHQELNLTDEPVRVIQIWYAADPAHRGLEAHYQQAGPGELPATQVGDATVWSLIGGGSPMQQHMHGRLTASHLPAGGTTTIAPPEAGEDLFLYITDGEGQAASAGSNPALGQYDVLLADPQAGELTFSAGTRPLDWMCFYLPKFINAAV